IIGVLRPWAPQPRFYALHLGGRDYGKGEGVFMPLQGARADGTSPSPLVGPLLAKCLRRSRELGVRRALGASRGAIFTQFMVEAAIVGVAGGVLGLVF